MGLLKEFGDSVKDLALRPALSYVANHFINPVIKRYGTIDQLYFQDKRFYVKLILLGMEDTPFECSVGHLYIKDDFSTIQFGDFQANKPFLQNILDDFATKEFKIPANEKVILALKTIKKHIN